MKYSEMQAAQAKAARAGEKVDAEQVAESHAASRPRKQSDKPVPARVYRLTSPVLGHEYCLQVEVNGTHYDALGDVVVDDRGHKSFEFGKLERLSAKALFRGATVEGERRAMPKAHQDLVEQAEVEAELDDGPEAIEALGRS